MKPETRGDTIGQVRNGGMKKSKALLPRELEAGTLLVELFWSQELNYK